MRAPSPTAETSTVAEPAARLALAEDDPDLRGLLADELRERGFDVIEAADGSSLLQILQRSALALVITDLWMPSLSGGDVIHMRRRSGDATPFIVITAAPAWVTVQVAALDGVTVLRKPFAADVLIGAVRRILDGEPASG